MPKKITNLDPQPWEDIQKAKTSQLPKKAEFTQAIENSKSGAISKAVNLLNKIKIDVEKRLTNLQSIEKHGDLINIVSDPDILRIAYNKLSTNKGALTAGPYGRTADGFSEQKIQEMSKQLLTGKYQWAPIKRIMIPKPGKTVKRPLGIPDFDDKIVQESIRMVLESIYEPHFNQLDANSGFRPNRDCAYAIRKIRQKAQFSTHVIEGDIIGAYNNVNHTILIKTLSKRIKDKKFLNLILSGLKSGIMDKSIILDSFLGVPQGGICSPILFNIYMHEFDEFVLSLQSELNTIKPSGPKVNSDYAKLKSQQSRLIKQINKIKFLQELSDEKLMKEKNAFPLMRDIIEIIFETQKEYDYSLIPWYPRISELYFFIKKEKDLLYSAPNRADSNAFATERRQLPRTPKLLRQLLSIQLTKLEKNLQNTKLEKLVTPYTNQYGVPLRIFYHRYADDFTIWLSGPKEIALEIKEKIAQFLTNHLKLQLSPDKTFITNILKDKVRFLGFEIYLNKNSKVVRDKNNNLRNIRTLQVNPDSSRLETRFLLKGLIIKKNGQIIPKEIGWLTPHTDHQIIRRYNQLMIGLSNYLVTEITDISSINRWIYYLYFSCIKTLATKHKISVRTVIERYGFKDLSIPNPLPRNKTLATDLRITCKFQIDDNPPQYTTLLNYKELMYTQSIPHRNRYLTAVYSRTDSPLTNPIDFNTLHKINSRTQFKLTSRCSIFGSPPPLNMHHIRKLNVKGILGSGYRGFDKIVAALNRKQIPV